MIYFVGAGSGAPDLITVRGARLLSEADVIVYAGSLVNPALLDYKKDGCEVYNSAKMTLEEVIAVMAPAAKAGKTVVRLHTGDPCVYGAHREQMLSLIHIFNSSNCFFLAQYPEEHNAGQSSAERADVNGNNVHPLRGPRLDCDGNDQTDHTDGANGCCTLELELLLQEGNRCLVQVYDGGYACEQYADVEDRADDTAGRHCVEYVYEVNEHQAGAALYVVDAFAQNNCHCRNDNDCCQQSCDGIKYCNVACGGRDILALGQVGTVD